MGSEASTSCGDVGASVDHAFSSPCETIGRCIDAYADSHQAAFEARVEILSSANEAGGGHLSQMDIIDMAYDNSSLP